MAISCRQFTDFLSRRTEHLDDLIIRSMHPVDTWIGQVNVARFKAQDGVEHTFDRFENVFPDLTGAWEDVTAASCVGQPCDPASKTIGLGFTRDSYKLQRRSYNSDLFCFDQILSADRAKQQFAHVIRVNRRASSLVTSHRFRTEALRIAKYKWSLANNSMVPLTATWDATMTYLSVNQIPTSKVSARHLQRRVQPQIREGALSEDINRGTQPMLEFVTDMDEVWNIVEGSPELTDHWRFTDFVDAEKYHKYGWTGKVGNYGLRADWTSLRFNIVGPDPAIPGNTLLQLVFPYTNVNATEGIKEQVNSDYDNAPIQLDFIWHRMAMTSLVRDTTAINPEMPFAMRDFAGRWQFVMDNLTCGTDVNGNPIAVDNSRRNKGKFIADFSYATKAEYPELAEVFLHLREPACVVDVPTCASAPYPNPQSYNSANALCPAGTIVLTFTPVLDSATGTYEVARDSITCNGLNVLNSPITGTSTLTALVAQLNSTSGTNSMGTWAVSGANITLTGSVCQSVAIPWLVD
jgi:hypothetical protein